jgi:ubiquinone/menaquinone biosynthesis C-methylase UbiE
MSFYSHYLLPRLINGAMSREDVTRLRAAHIPAARGAVLEVGIGSGLNLPFYTSSVTYLAGVDPSAELLAMARPRAAVAPFPVEFLQRDASALPLASESVDTVVMTWSLCSIARPDVALREIRRVMKPDATLIFVEHGLSPDAGVEKWQNRLTPVWRRLAGGCHLNRDIRHLIRSAGFAIRACEVGYMPGPRPATYTYQGQAMKVSDTGHRPSTDNGP